MTDSTKDCTVGCSGESKGIGLSTFYHRGKRQPDNTRGRYYYKSFGNLQEATRDFDQICTNGEETLLLARDVVPHSGAKKFIVTRWRCFADYYLSPDRCPSREFYEVIREGAHCALYLDFDCYDNERRERYPRDLNNFTSLFETYFMNKFPSLKIKRPTVDLYFLFLDSSDASKISYHVIVRIMTDNVEYQFKNNFYCGGLIKGFLRSVKAVFSNAKRTKFLGREFDQEDIRGLMAISDDVDCSVYSKNRCFRLFLSAKKGKTAHLVFSTLTRPEVLEDSSSSSPQGTRTILRMSMLTLVNRRMLQFLQLPETDAPTKGLRLSLRSDRDLNIHQQQEQQQEQGQEQAASEGTLTRACPDYLIPFLERFCKDGGRPTQIHQHCTKSNLYVIRTNSHSCPYKGADHQSNHIYFVLDTTTALLFVNCYDPDCRTRHLNEYVLLENASDMCKKINEMFKRDRAI